nr:retrotransposon protein, putative, Ty1-copia subclass [Tanacetum cinerariifolium]
MEDNVSILDQVHEFLILVSKFKNLNIDILENLLVGAIITKLPSSWHNYRKKLMHTSEDFTLDQIQKNLRIKEETHVHEKNLNGASSSKVNYVDSEKNNKVNDKKRKGTRNSSKNNKKDKKPLSKVVCYKYGEKRHIKWYCKNPKKKNQNSNKKDESANVVEQVDTIEITAMVSEMNIGMIQELDLFKTYKETEDGDEVMMGDNHTSKVIGSGNVEIQFTFGKKLTLMNVLHVPNIRKNLVSGFKLYKSGVKAVIELDKVILSKAIVFVGKAYTYVYLLKSKDQAFKTFKIYKAKVENKKGKKIQILRSDRGGEYFSIEFSSYCEAQGLIHQRTTPYTPQQNGVAERKNKVLQDMIKAMLVSANLLKNLWGEALLTACHVSNRITTKKLKVSSYEVWKGRKPNISYFRVWGCLAYYKITLCNTSKLGSRGIKSIIVGYAKDSKSYRCLDLDSNVIVESRDVDFFENKFRYDSTSTNEIVTQIPQDISGLNLNSNNKKNMAESSSEPRRSERAKKERNLDPDFIDSQAIIFLVEGDNKNNVINNIPVILNVEDAPKTYKEAITSRNSAFWNEMKDMKEVDTILGIKVKRHSGDYALNQCHYIDKIIDKFQHLNIEEANTPYESSYKLVENDRRAVAQIEYASAIGKEAKWLRNMLLDIKLWPQPMPTISLHCDSQSTLSKAYNKVYNGKSRDISLRHTYIKELISNGIITIEYISSCKNLVDPFTTGLLKDIVFGTTKEMGLKPIE